MALWNQEKAIILNSYNILNMLIILRVIKGTFRDQRHLKCSKTWKSDQRHSKVIEDIQKWLKTFWVGRVRGRNGSIVDFNFLPLVILI